MGKREVSLLLGLALASGSILTATAQESKSTPKGAAAPPAAGKTDTEVLTGYWVRPDGGYTIAIRGIAPNGRLDATYFNPNPLPFAKAQASRDGGTLRVFLELRAGGYGGSTYDLTYDPASGRLKGIYYQAVAKQRYEVYFVRK